MEMERAVCIWLLRKRIKKRRIQISPATSRENDSVYSDVIQILPGKSRENNSVYSDDVHKLYSHWRKNEEIFIDIFKMSVKTFDILTDFIMCYSKDTTKEHVIMTIRFLASGCSLDDLGTMFDNTCTDIPNTIRQVCQVICQRLKGIVMPQPTGDIWKKSAMDFKHHFNFPNCVGAIGGKHIVINKSDQINMKQAKTLLLFAICDHKSIFLITDIGEYGCFNERNIFDKTMINKKLRIQKLALPMRKFLQPNDPEKAPYVFAGDTSFVNRVNILRPFVTVYSNKVRLFNNHLHRAHSPVEVAFAMLADKWQILQNINADVEFAAILIETCCILYNFVKSKNEWKIDDYNSISPFIELPRARVGKTQTGTRVRNQFFEYLSKSGRLELEDTLENQSS